MNQRTSKNSHLNITEVYEQFVASEDTNPSDSAGKNELLNTAIDMDDNKKKQDKEKSK